MVVTCQFCNQRIQNPDTADLCVDSHERSDGPLPLHDTCPCPVHDWESNREYLVREDR